MTNKKFKRRKPVIQTSAWQMPKINFDGIANALMILVESEAFKEAAAKAERIRASR